jgi:hypothetical protein
MERCQTFLCGEETAVKRRRGRDGGEGTAVKGRWGVVCGEDDEAADRWGRLVSERERERGAGWRARGGRPGVGRERRSAGVRGGESRVLGRDSVQQGRERVFPFSFYFSNPFSLFAPFLLNKIFCE